MPYVETEEQQMLRKQVREIGRKYGREYYAEKARSGESPDELWRGFDCPRIRPRFGGLVL